MTLEALEARMQLIPSRLAAGFEQQTSAPAASKQSAVGVIPIRGSISHHEDMWSWLFGDTTVDSVSKALSDFAGDAAIKAIVLDIDSPGGSTNGITELAAEIRSLRATKPIVAVANGMAASAAYDIGASATTFYATPSALVGSIGVYMLHMDYSEYLAEAGIKPTFVSAGKYKVEGNDLEPLADEARAHLQSIVDAAYEQFISDVAKGRKVSEATVRKDFGEGRVVTARQAKAIGMVDGIATLDAVIRRAPGMKTSAPEPIEEPSAEGTDLDIRVEENTEGTHLLAQMWNETRAALVPASGG